MDTSKIIVPTGNTAADLKKRAKIIIDFYSQWEKENPLKRVKNEALGTFVNIRYVSIDETQRHASKNYLSTLAVLQLDAILAGAKKVGKPVPADHTKKNQRQFNKMQIMKYTLAGIGTVKLTVGIKKNKDYVQYCITAIEA